MAQDDGIDRGFVSYRTEGADYAEFFQNEEKLKNGDLAGLNLSTGKEQAKLLINGKADLNIPDAKEKTPLVLSKEMKRPHIEAMLKNVGAR